MHYISVEIENNSCCVVSFISSVSQRLVLDTLTFRDIPTREPYMGVSLMIKSQSISHSVFSVSKSTDKFSSNLNRTYSGPV
jgi:hypothetical protein